MDFTELADDLDRRDLEQEEEEAAKASAHLASEALPVLWNQSVRAALFPSGIVVDTLVLACHRTACALLNHLAPGKQTLGTILLPEQDMKGNTALPGSPAELSDKHCVMYVVPPAAGAPSSAHPSLLVSCQFQLSAERAVSVCQAMLAEVCPETVLVLGALPAEVYKGPGDPAEEPLLFALHTAATCGSTGTDAAPPSMACDPASTVDTHAQWPPGHLPVLPSGNVVGGLPAAVLQYCQVRHMRAGLLLAITGPPHLVAMEVSPLAAALSVYVGPGTAAAWQVHQAVSQARTQLGTAVAGSPTHL